MSEPKLRCKHCDEPNPVLVCYHCGHQFCNVDLERHKRAEQMCIVCLEANHTIFCEEHNIWLCGFHYAGHERAAHMHEGA